MKRFLSRFILVTFICSFLGGYYEFVTRIKTAQPGTGSADGIVVLTGGSNRLARGLELFANGKAGHMLVSGVHPDVSNDWLRKNLAVSGMPSCCIAIGREAMDTVGNAVETGRWRHANYLSRLHVVTSAYHMPRALLEFRRHLPDNVTLIPQPVQTERVLLDSWWKPTGSSLLLLTEYGKFLIGSLRFALWGPSEINAGKIPDRFTLNLP